MSEAIELERLTQSPLARSNFNLNALRCSLRHAWSGTVKLGVGGGIGIAGTLFSGGATALADIASVTNTAISLYAQAKPKETAGQLATRLVGQTIANAVLLCNGHWRQPDHAYDLASELIQLDANPHLVDIIISQVPCLDPQNVKSGNLLLKSLFQSLTRGTSTEILPNDAAKILEEVWANTFVGHYRVSLSALVPPPLPLNSMSISLIGQLQRQAAEIIHAYRVKDMMGENFPVSDVVVPVIGFVTQPLRVTQDAGKKYQTFETRIRVNLFEAISREISENSEGPVWLMSGPPGIGKTTLARQIADRYVNLGWNVLFVPLQHLARACNWVLDEHAKPVPGQESGAFSPAGLLTNTLGAALESLPQKNTLVVCDGLDELGQNGADHNVQAYTRLADALSRLLNPSQFQGLRVLLAGRPNSAENASSALGIKDIAVRRFELWRVCPPALSLETIQQIEFDSSREDLEQMKAFWQHTSHPDARIEWWRKFAVARGLDPLPLPAAFEAKSHPLIEEMGEPLLLYLMTWSALKEKGPGENPADCIDRLLGSSSSVRAGNRAQLFERVLEQVHRPIYDPSGERVNTGLKLGQITA